jgi:restriction system protein
LEKTVPPTEFENSPYPNHPNVRRYERIVRFSTIGAVKAGWLIKNKGLWSITDEGKKAFEKFADPEKFIREADRLYRQWEEKRPEEDAGEAEEDAEDAITIEEAEESAWSEIEEYLAKMNPYDFQNLVAGLLVGMGYSVSWISPPGADGGIDVVAYSDPLGVKGPRIKVQAKRKEQKVNVEGMRSFMAVLSEGDIGLFVSLGGFTKDAEEEARNHQTRRLLLVDARRLFDLWVEHYDRIPEINRRTFALKPVHFLAPEE